jgi:predicted RNA-binding protein with PIN domain
LFPAGIGDKIGLNMPYLIDGHNLIPKLGLRLASPDDELDLVARLLEFCRLRRTQAEVYFDGAPAGEAGVQPRGAVTAHFVRLGSSADAALEARLVRLGKSARNWTLVSSDARVQQAGRAAHAAVQSSEEFARAMAAARTEAAEKVKKTGERLNPEEVEAWLAEFKGRPPKP